MRYAIVFENGDAEVWDCDSRDDVEYLAYLVATAKCTTVKTITLVEGGGRLVQPGGVL